MELEGPCIDSYGNIPSESLEPLGTGMTKEECWIKCKSSTIEKGCEFYKTTKRCFAHKELVVYSDMTLNDFVCLVLDIKVLTNGSVLLNSTLILFLNISDRVRADHRCGPAYPLPNGSPGECDPHGDYYCCSQSGYCGNTAAHCKCDHCVDFNWQLGKHKHNKVQPYWRS